MDGIRINIKDAKLRVINTAENNAIINATNCNPDAPDYIGWQAFNTYGVSATDPTVARDACYFLLGERVVLNVKTYGVAVMYIGTKAEGYLNYGNTVDIKGEIYASEGNGIATNGNMSFKKLLVCVTLVCALLLPQLGAFSQAAMRSSFFCWSSCIFFSIFGKSASLSLTPSGGITS